MSRRPPASRSTRSLALVSVLVAGVAVLSTQACGSTANPGEPIGGADVGDGSADLGSEVVTDSMEATDEGGLNFDLGGGCPTGTPCGTGGICSSGGTCCEPASAVCGASCCGSGTVCYSGKCVTPGKPCRSSDECGPGETCDPTLGAGLDAGPGPACGDAAPTPSDLGRCVPRPPTCPAGTAPDGTCVEACEYRPPIGKFDPVVEWSWPSGVVVEPTYNQVMASAAVGPLTDDNCDGKYDAKDLPAIVFNTYKGAGYSTDGILRAVTGKGKTLWDATDLAARTVPGASIAIGELDPTSPGPEIATCSTDQKLIVFSAAGKVLWKSDDPKIICNYGGPQLGDVNGDGIPELLLRYTVVDARTHKATFQGRVSAAPYPTADYSTFADVDLDGDLDIVGGNVVYVNDGTGVFTVLWDGSKFPKPISDGYVAVADLDLAPDGLPEIVVVGSLEQGTHDIRVVSAKDGKTLWGPFDTNLGGETLAGGGPPTIADFDGDGKPEVAMAGGYSYNVYEGATGKLKWSAKTKDTSSRVTGSSVFDFDGDGKAEVIYADELNLHIYEGPTGKELLTLCNPSGTLWEYPLVADVDGDDQAEIVVVANDMWWGCSGTKGPGTGPTGLRVIGSKSGAWVTTRRIWNQHTYHVTNVNDDATIPALELANWKDKKLNNFRQNVQPGSLFDAPNAVADIEGNCASTPTLRARIRNIGRTSLPAGIVVGFYSGEPGGEKTKLGNVLTTKAILPGGSEYLEFRWDSPVAGYSTGAVGVFVVVDDDPTPHTWHECKTEDNTSPVFKKKCTG